MAPVDESLHPVLHAGRVAVITGAASGIGRAAAKELAKIGMRIALADTNAAGLEVVAKEVAAEHARSAAAPGEGTNVLVVPTDVSKIEEVVRLKERVYETFGEVAVLLNNAGIGARGTSWAGLDAWHRVFEVNLFGIVNVQQTFVPMMLHQENHAVIINTGSKQGITNPPGNAAYNTSKAAVKSLTEGLAHELRERHTQNVTAHLFIPGWVHTGLSHPDGDTRADHPEKPAGAWSPEETVLFMLDKVRAGEFYILCPDNETRTAVDHLRIMWVPETDITEGRPALSRWHPTYKSLFEEYMRDGLAEIQ